MTRAIRVPGRERRTLVQTAKATFAATGAWLLATLVLDLSQPFLAPYAAVFVVGTTVYRSVLGWAQQVGSVATGVLLAAAAGHLIPSQAAALAVVVFAGLLIGSWSRFGESGIWVGVTGMLLISYGTATEPVVLGDRLLETALGAAIGVAVNALIFPPLYGERLASATTELAGALADLLRDTADLVLADEPPEDVGEWLNRAQDVGSRVAVAEDAEALTREGRWFNLRRGHPSAGAAQQRPLRTVLALWGPVSHLVDAVRTASARQDPFGYPWPAVRTTLAQLMRELAEVVRTAGDPDGPGHLDGCRERLAEIDRVLIEPPAEPSAALGLGTMALPLRHLVERLEGG